MVLFSVCLLTACLAAIFRWRPRDGQLLAMGLLCGYMLIYLVGTMVAGYRGAEPDVVFGEIQQSLYWLAAPFFAMVLQSRDIALRAGSMVWKAGILMAAIYLAALIGLAVGLLNFGTLYSIVSTTEEFRARGSGLLFYKGFLYLGIAIVFLMSLQVRFWVVGALVILVALVLTLTRGFVLATAISTLLLLLYQRRFLVFSYWLPVTLGALYVVWTYIPSVDTTIVSARDISNAQRVDDLSFIGAHMSTATILIGEGFGSLINNRVGIENTFLWAFWKLGLMGLTFWLTPLVLCLYYFARIPQRASNGLACAFMFGVVLVYTETATNPYLNNPIGLSFVMLALFSLRTLAKRRRNEPAMETGGSCVTDPRGAA